MQPTSGVPRVRRGLRRSCPLHHLRHLPVALIALIALVASGAHAAFVDSVVSYSQGTVAFANPTVSYNNAAEALGAPNRIAGAGDGFPGPVTPFNPPYEEIEIVDVGVGGSITLGLSTPVAVTAGQPQIGIFTSVGLNDPTFSGQAQSPAETFAGDEYGADRSAVVEVAQTLGDFRLLGRVIFANPTQGYANQSDPYTFPSPLTPSDFDKPFTGNLSSFDGLSSSQITAMLDGSAGGTWLSIPSGLGLSSINYVRISDPMWVLHSDSSLHAERPSAYLTSPQFIKPADLFIDAVNVVAAAEVVPEPGGVVGLCVVIAAMTTTRRRSRRRST